MSLKVMLVDGNSIINRAFYALPILTNKDGEYTNAVYGFLNILFKFIDEEKPDSLAVAFDLPKKTFRHEKFEAYKGTRKSMPEELRPQIPLLKELLKKMNIDILEMEGFEADDILGTLGKRCKENGNIVTIVSGDKDLLQLADENIKIKIPKTKGGKTEVEEYGWDDVLEKIGVTPIEYIDVKALMGDTSDNIPGVPSIGEKTAVKIIQEYKNIEAAIENADKIKPKKASENLVTYKDQAILSKELATIYLEVPVGYTPKALEYDEIYNPEAFEEFKRLGFKNYFKRFSDKDSGTQKTKELEINIIDTEDKAKKFSKELLKKDLVSYTLLEVSGVYYGVSFSFESHKSTLILYNPLNESIFFEILKPFFESNVPKIALDSKSDKVYLHGFNIKIENVIFDTMLGGYVINSSKTSYDYNDIAFDFLNETYISEEELFGKGKSKKTIDEIPPEELYKFSGRKSEVAFRAYPKMKENIKENDQEFLYYEIELPLVDVLKDMELFGMKIDRSSLLEYQKELEIRLNALTTDIYKLSGEEFNINSPQQLGIILFEKLGLEGGKKTKTGYSTAHDVLEKLLGKHEIIDKILEYRTLSKLKSTYADGLLSILKEDDKIFSTFNQFITTTGRISSTEPNLQNIPIRMEVGRLLRKVFIPSKEKYVFLDADYSQIELRVLASLSGDQVMIDAFINGEDIHRLTAAQAFDIPIDEVTETQRSNAKAVNFGIVYGIGAFSLSQDLKITRNEASKYIDGYFEKYPRVKVYLDEIVESATEKGYAETLFKRRRNIPELTSSNFNQRGFGKRVAMNMPVQGTAADIIKIAMVKVRKRIIDEKIDARLILQVHDELLLEVNRNSVEVVNEIIKEEMENAVKLKVPLTVSQHIGENWYDAK